MTISEFPNKKLKNDDVIIEIPVNYENNQINEIPTIFDPEIVAQIIQDETIFFEKLEQLDMLNVVADENGFSIVSSIQTKKYFLKPEYELSLTTLHEYFPDGHSLAIDMSSNYFVPLMIDMDHEHCGKRHTCEIIMTTQSTVVKDVFIECMKYLKIYKTSNDYNVKNCLKDMSVFQKQCGLHIYINAKVSIIVYELLLDYLNSTLFEKYGYVFDKVQLMPLPYTIKKKEKLYLPMGGHDQFQIILNSDMKLFDVEMQTSYVLCKDLYCIGTVKQEYIANDDEWFELDESNSIEFLYTKNEIQTVMEIPNCIVRFQSCHIDSKIHNLIVYLENKSCNQLDINCTYKFDENIEIKLIKLSSIIQNTVKHYSHQKDSFVCIYRLMMGPEYSCGYVIYIIFALISYLYTKSDSTIEQSMDIVEKFIMHTSSANKNCDELIKFTWENIKKSNSTNECLELFSDYITIFRYISRMEYFNRTMNDDHKSLMNKCLEREFDPQCSSRVIELKLEKLILPFLYPSIKPAKSSDKFMLFDLDKFYELDMMEYDLFVKKPIFSNLIDKLLSVTQKTNVKEFNGNLKVSWSNYVTTFKHAKIQYARYHYFINTDLGYFSNIHGMYMIKTPYLYFAENQCKSYGTLPVPIPKVINMSNTMNNQIHSTTLKLDIIMQKLFTLKFEPFQFFVLLPGLISLSELINFDVNDCNKIMHVIATGISENNITLFLKHFKSVMIRYPIESKHVIAMAFLIQELNKNSKTFGKINLDNLNQIFSVNCDIVSRVARDELVTNMMLDYRLNGCDFITSILNNYPTIKILKSSFIQSYIYILLCLHIPFPDDLFIGNLNIVEFATINETDLKIIDDIEMNLDRNFNFIVGSKYQSDDFDINSFNNMQRGMNICFAEQLPDELFSSLNTLFGMFSYNMLVVKEFLMHHSLIFQPYNDNKKFIMYRGSKNCGKSYLTNRISDMHGSSSCPVNSRVKSASGGDSASERSILMATSYLTTIKEASYIDAPTIKALTGDDSTLQRNLYSKYRCIEPISFIICITNTYPDMNADESVRDRICIFYFNQSYIDYEELRQTEYNPLLLFINQHIVKLKQSKEKAFTSGLANLFYSTFRYFRNENGSVVPQLTNSNSAREKSRFMAINNPVYHIMDLAGIERNDDYEITYNELSERVNFHLKNYNKNRTKQYSWISFITTFNEIFDTNQVKDDPSSKIIKKYQRVGIPIKYKNNLFQVIESIGQKITKKQILDKISLHTHLSAQQRRFQLERFTNKYKKNLCKNEFHDLAFSENN